jgi:DNA mismatch repair protein MutL
VDVNCHPAKREVRFSHEGKVYSALQRAVRAALVADSPVPPLRLSGGATPQTEQAERSGFIGGVVMTPGFFSSAFGGRREEGHAASPHGGETPRQALAGLRVVGQVKRTYIVAEGADGMYLVDQHAAHERVLFDQICRNASRRSPQSQPLLEPVTVELTPGQADLLVGNSEALARYGFQVEPFGGSSYLLRAVPAILTTQDPGQSLRDTLDLVAVEGLQRQREDILAASIACHSAIRAGQALTEAEMRALLERLEATDNPHTCPHGRPTMIHLSSYLMEREFGRR